MGSYLERHLIPGESVVYRGRPHPIALLPSVALAALAAALAAGALAYAPARQLLAVAPLFALAALPGYLRHRAMEIVVTNRRLCVRSGFYRVETLETVLNKVGTIAVVQTPWGRLLDYGTLVIKGMGASSEAVRAVAAPFLLRGKIHEAIALPATKPRVDKSSEPALDVMPLPFPSIIRPACGLPAAGNA